MLLNEEKKSMKGLEFSCTNSVANVKLATKDMVFVDKGATSPSLSKSSVHIAM
jgi:hypothetical protein